VNPYAVKHGLGRAWGLSVLSFGLWTVLWLHRTRRLFDGELGRGRDDAVLHTVGLLVPIWNVFVIFWLYRDLDELRRRAGLAGIPVAAFVVGAVLAQPVIYSLVLLKVNEFWDVRTQGLAVEAPVTGGERAVVAVGVLWWLLWIAWAVLLVLFSFGAGPLA
jgi:hypothetical protein